uniref:SEC7 domain-containing protein n=1 Tax=Panagrellus redivivus TaxID=6233 RepID=A0A7E4W5I4_PANRE
MTEVISRIAPPMSAKSQQSTGSPSPGASRIPRFDRRQRESGSGSVDTTNTNQETSTDNVVEGRSGDNSSSGSPTSSNSKQRLTPRYEAFVMTGDKILTVNNKVSPSFAQAYSKQLPPTTEILEPPTTPTRTGAFDDFPSMQHRNMKRRFEPETAVPASQSERILLQSEDDEFSSQAYNADRASPSNMIVNEVESKNHSVSTLPENTILNSGSSTARLTRRMTDDKQSSFINPKLVEAGRSTDIHPATNGHTYSPPGTFSPQHRRSRSRLTITNSVSIDLKAAAVQAQRMFNLEGYNRLHVSQILMQKDVFSEAVTLEFLNLLEFASLKLDVALRLFFNHVRLIGESDNRANLLKLFAARYWECNPTLYNSCDELHTLTCALLLLNSDLHGPNTGKKMALRDFVENIGNTGCRFERNLLRTLYNDILAHPFKYDEDEKPNKSSEASTSRASGVLRSLSKKVSKKAVLPDFNKHADYRHGWLVKKSIYDTDGKRTPLGRRHWKTCYGTVRGMVLYLHKDEKCFEAGHFAAFNGCILLHHCVASVERDYKKRANCFHLRTANFGEFLFQTGNPQEVASWVEAINFVSAAFSLPVLPAPAAAINDALPFHKPLLPSAPTKLAIPDQLKSHQEKVIEMEERLASLRQGAPPMKAKGKSVYDYFYRERYLENERDRYSTYVNILRAKLEVVSQNELCSRRSSMRALTTPARQNAYITSIPITSHTSSLPPSAGPTTAFGTMSSGHVPGSKKSVNASREASFSNTPALAEAMRIANGCLPSVHDGEVAVYSDDDQGSYKKAVKP